MNRDGLYQLLATNAELRQRFEDDPRAALTDWVGQDVPEGMEVVLVEDSLDRIHVVMPPASVTKDDGTMTDAELEATSGGGVWLAPGFFRDVPGEDVTFAT